MQRVFNRFPLKPFFRNGSKGIDNVAEELWTPTLLGSPLVGWWDASDPSTVTIATGVSEITDKSGNSRTFSQATGADQPALITGELNGLSVMRFDGNGDSLATASRVTIRTLILLAKWSATTGDYRHIWDMTATGNGWHGATVASGNLLDSSLSSVLIRNGDKYVNGTPTTGLLNRYTNWTIHGFETTGDINPISTGRQASFSTRSFLGDYAEFMYLSSVPSAGDRQKIEGYLAHKWGIQASLPSDHPYKSAPPIAS
jgi:hypothetical protein